MSAIGGLQLSRREFLVAANAAALLALIESCAPGAALRQAASPSGVQGHSVYEQALMLLRDAVRASPDHLTQRAAELESARDANKIVEFVRDRVAVLPAWSFLDDPRTARRWGDFATLRGGQGSLRDRAELLAGMLTRAGFAATVVSADQPAIGIDALFQSRAVPFAPDDSRVEKAARLLGQAPSSAPAAPGGPDPVPAILGALPSSVQYARTRDDLLPLRMPLVQFEMGGQKQYAFALGDLAITSSAPAGLAPVAPADSPPVVTITVSALSNPALGSSTPRGQLIDLVTGHWPADAVVGRQVLLTFMPDQGPKACLQAGLAALPVRLPILRVQSDAAQPTGLAVAGQPITVQGDQFSATPNATGADADGPFGKIRTLSDADRAKALARATTLRVRPKAGSFPEIELEVAVLDSAGASVDGLDARSFTIKEEGQPVGSFNLLSNVPLRTRPRVMIAYDTSGSVRRAWPSPAARAAFENSLASSITNAASEVAFDTQVVQLGFKPDPNGWATPQVGSLAAGMAGFGFSDATWSTIAGPALDQGVSAIVYVGDSSDEDTPRELIPALKRRMATSGVPVFCVPTGPPAGPSLTEIAKISSGKILSRTDASTPARIAALLKPVLADWLGGGYRLRYGSTGSDASIRHVTVGMTGRDTIAGSATYQVPAKPLPPPSFTGLYVTITAGGVRSFRRLAGLELSFNGAILGELDDPAAVAETRAALNGVTTIAIEPGTPTAAALLDDVIASYLSIEPLRPIIKTATADQLLAAVSKGVWRTPAALAGMIATVPTDPHAIPAFKVAILQERQTAPGLIEMHADLAIGANPMVVTSSDPHAAFTAALISSVAASAAEASAFEDSAYERLSGQRLVALPVTDFGAYNSFFATVPANKQARWRTAFRMYGDQHVVAPAGAAVDAFWVVDPNTGVGKAVLLDGTGGAYSILECELSGPDIFSLVLSVLGLVCTIGGAAINPWFCLGVTVASVIVTVVIIFQEANAPGTPYGTFAGVFGAIGRKTPRLGGRLGVAGVIIILTTISLEC